MRGAVDPSPPWDLCYQGEDDDIGVTFRKLTWILLGVYAAYYYVVLCFFLPVPKIVNGLLDDSLFTFEVARNLAHGFGSSFDRSEPTNGYHPLWMLLLMQLPAIAGSPRHGGPHARLGPVRDLQASALSSRCGAFWRASAMDGRPRSRCSSSPGRGSSARRSTCWRRDSSFSSICSRSGCYCGRGIAARPGRRRWNPIRSCGPREARHGLPPDRDRDHRDYPGGPAGGSDRGWFGPGRAWR